MIEKILLALRTAPEYFSGEEISRNVNISRAAVWKYIEELRKLGYDIDAVPHMGYRLLSGPDVPFPWEVTYQLGTKILGRKVHYHREIASTMDEAFARGMAGDPEGTVVCAEFQAKGRGRLGRSWISPKGKGVYLTLLLRPPLSPAEVANLTLLSAVAVCEAIIEKTGVEARIKWPNDLLINGKKVAGILTEMNAEFDRVKFVIVGIGINVNASPAQLPDEATSLKAQADRKFSKVELIQEILRKYEKWYLESIGKGFAPVLERWKMLSLTMKYRVRVEQKGVPAEGAAFDLAQDGSLLVRKDSGEIIKHVAGDVMLLKQL